LDSDKSALNNFWEKHILLPLGEITR